MLIYEDQFGYFKYDAAQGLFEIVTTMTAANTPEEFKAFMQTYAAQMIPTKAPKLLLDTSQSSFIITPDLQEWVATEIAPQTIGAGQRFVATILPPDLFSAIAMEQLMDEGIITTVQNRYFDSRPKALEWLQSV
ncbi:hypothetical protein [Rhodoflexus sp.]